MLMLFFYVGESSYAIDTKYVIEVIPKIKLKRIPQAPEYVAGLMNFGCVPIPVVDFCQLIDGNPCHACMHTRIMILNYINVYGTNRQMGLIAEKVTETFEQDPDDFLDSGVQLKSLPFMGGVLSTEQQSTQFVYVDKLFDGMEGILF